MGTVLSAVETVTIDKKSLDEYMDKYDTMVEELLLVKAKLKEESVKNQQSVNELSSVNRELAKERESVSQLFSIRPKLHEMSIKCRELETTHKSLKKTNEDHIKKLSTSKKKIDDLKEHNSNLQNEITRLNNDLKQAQSDNRNLKNKITENEASINGQKSSINRLEKELHINCEQLLELKQKLKEETVTDETLRKLIRIYRRIKDLQEVISTKTNILVKQIKQDRRDEKDKIIEKLKSDYDNCEKILESKNISVHRTNFIDIYSQYKHLLHRNDENKRNVLKEIYHIAKSTQKFLKKYKTFTENLSNAVDLKEEAEKKVNANVLAQELTAEEELYQEVLKIAGEEIGFREKLLSADTEAAKISKIKNCNILNNRKQLKKNDTEDVYNVSGPSTSVILIDAPNGHQSETEDYLMVYSFLRQNGIEDKGVTVRRYGIQSAAANKPLIINFTNRYCVDKIFEMSKNNGWFHGHNPNVRVYQTK